MGRKKKTDKPLSSLAIKFPNRAALKVACDELRNIKKVKGYERNIQGAIEILRKLKQDVKKDKVIKIDFNKGRKK